MKFYAYCHNKTLEDNNGGSLVLWHHGHALEELNHVFGGMLNLTDEIPEDADYIMFQSEWYSTIKSKLEKSKAKRICWLGHYFTGSRYGMIDIREIKADYFHTQYKGEAVEKAKQLLGAEIHYLPHGVCTKCNTEGTQISSPKVLFIGNHFPERSESWLENVTLVQAPFKEIKNYYKSALVCPNIHGDWQKGKATEFFTVPAEMINERLFQIYASGGFGISDNTPIVKDFFQNLIPYAETKEKFQGMIKHYLENPNERLDIMQKVREHIFTEHTYTHRLKKFLSETKI